MLYLWNAWLRLVNDSWLTYQEIKAYCELTGLVFTPGEVEQIRTLDRLYWRTLNDN
ncbi:hypothetical protein LVQ77_16985 [Buttiauxella sp. S04-F03]|uniref:phage tail assembly chaperone n=1 Tax=Buttiauxella sp. W03-F01 TaxID=2904524 RepID=UPI001E2A9031|nr:hypothetical protein [Buttiauxella sp. W03-F01]MCE0801981.1 hypothetical protein [Buttiauxella sp. W03-F01]